jgi:SulP family sulfate permease
VFSAAAVAGTVLLFAPLAQFIPRAALAGLLLLAAFRMVDRGQLAFHLRATRLDAGVVLATALAAVAISVEFCILIGVFLSFVLYVPRAAQVRLAQLVRTPGDGAREWRPGEPACDRMLIYRLEGELFFGAEPELEKHLATIDHAACGGVRAVLLILERARNPDAGFLGLLRAFNRNLRRRDVALLLCGVKGDLVKALVSTALDAEVGVPRIFCDRPGHDTTRDAIHVAYALFGDELCATCPRRQERACAVPSADYVI